MFRNLARSVQDIVYEQKAISNRSHPRITLIAFTPVRKIKVRLSRRHATEAASSFHRRPQRYPTPPELIEYSGVERLGHLSLRLMKIGHAEGADERLVF